MNILRWNNEGRDAAYSYSTVFIDARKVDREFKSLEGAALLEDIMHVYVQYKWPA